jgi:Skp family chaperone for outer membrane proteins
MKKIAIIFIKLSLLLAFIPSQLNAQIASANTEIIVPIAESKEAIEANVMLARLNEIKAMDKSNLTSSDKKELRKEVKTLKTNLKASGNGLYLSVGAIIIILLLLIILI